LQLEKSYKSKWCPSDEVKIPPDKSICYARMGIILESV